MNKLIYFTKVKNWGEGLMKILTGIASLLLVIGAINWGLVGLFKFDIVEALFGGREKTLSRIIYLIIGLAGIYTILYLLF